MRLLIATGFKDTKHEMRTPEAKKNENTKKDTCKLHAKVVVIEHQMNQKEKITIFENTLRLHNEQFILPNMR
jgi:hypothetical protein